MEVRRVAPGRDDLLIYWWKRSPFKPTGFPDFPSIGQNVPITPNKQEKATQTVLEQAEVLSAEWAAA